MQESGNSRIRLGLKECWAVNVEVDQKQVIRISDQSMVARHDDLDAYRNTIEVCALRLLSKVANKESTVEEIAAFEELAKELKLRPDERAEALRWFLHGRLSVAPAKALAAA